MVLFVLLAGFTYGAPVFAQSVDLTPVLNRLLRLERDIKTLNVQISRGNGGGSAGAQAEAAPPEQTQDAPPATARIAVKLSELEEELRAATGKVETIANQIEQVNLRLDKLITDLDYRLETLEANARQGTPGGSSQVSAASIPTGVQKAAPGSGQPGILGTISQSDLPGDTDQNQDPQKVASAPPGGALSGEVSADPLPAASGVLPEGTPKERYNYAFGLLRKANYDEAEVALAEFLKSHPDDPLSGNARYWLAESYYVRGQYVNAAEAFVAGYQADTSGPKAPDMLLKLGMSMSNLKKIKEACASFGKLLTDFPEASTRIISKVTFERNKIGCQ